MNPWVVLGVIAGWGAVVLVPLILLIGIVVALMGAVGWPRSERAVPASTRLRAVRGDRPDPVMGNIVIMHPTFVGTPKRVGHGHLTFASTTDEEQ